jgi:hypothetical protein
MRAKIRPLMAALTVAIVFSISTGTAWGRSRVEVSVTRITYKTVLSMTAGGTPVVDCSVTLLKVARRLSNKVRGAEVGTMEADTVNECRVFGGTARADMLTEAPFRVLYDSISGALPTITGARFSIVGGYLIEARTFIGNAACLYSGTIGVESTTNPIRTFRILPNTQRLVRDLGGSISCEATSEVAGTFTLTPEVTARLLER